MVADLGTVHLVGQGRTPRRAALQEAPAHNREFLFRSRVLTV
jgi:hypothetical protein